MDRVTPYLWVDPSYPKQDEESGLAQPDSFFAGRLLIRD